MLNNPVLNASFTTHSGVEFLQNIITVGIAFGFITGIVAFFVMLLVGAIGLITSGGDKANVENAKARMRNAIIGIVVLFSIYAIVQLFEVFFGISILSLDISNLSITGGGGGGNPTPPCIPGQPC